MRTKDKPFSKLGSRSHASTQYAFIISNYTNETKP